QSLHNTTHQYVDSNRLLSALSLSSASAPCLSPLLLRPPPPPPHLSPLSLHDALPISPLLLLPSRSRSTNLKLPTHRKPWPRRKPDRKSTRLNSSHGSISYAVFCLKKKRCRKQICYGHSRAS